MQDNEKKPALRFKGFTDPWEQRKLGFISNFKTKTTLRNIKPKKMSRIQFRILEGLIETGFTLIDLTIRWSLCTISGRQEGFAYNKCSWKGHFGIIADNRKKWHYQRYIQI